MVHVTREISKEEYQKALEHGPKSLLSEAIICGYGCYGAEVKEVEGKYYLSYSRGETCD